MQPSKRQQIVYDTWQNEDCNILISAVAGSGKTTSLMHLLGLCEHRTLFLAFNKSIQEEIQGRIDKNGLRQGKAMTMHSLGLASLKTKYKYTKVNGSKKYVLLKILQRDHKKLVNKVKWGDRAKLNYTLLDLNEVSRLFMTNDLKILTKQLKTMDKQVFVHRALEEIWEKFVEIREKSYIGNSIEIDFTDMVYLPIHLDLKIPIYPTYLFVDECQDLNLCQHKLIDKLISQGTITKWCAVGDRKQAIYGFSGAYSTSFEMFHHKDGIVKELPLDINYRSKSAIIAEANDVFDVMEGFHEDEGIVKTITEAAFIKPDSMVVCRNVKPLIDLYFQLLALKKPCYIKGEDIRGRLYRILSPHKKETVKATRMQMEYDTIQLMEDKTDEGRFKAYIAKENYAMFLTLTRHLATDMTQVGALLASLESIFKHQKGDHGVMLCSIHKSKGLESDIVYILNENLIPSQFAISEEQLLQEQNLKYVARTRAKEEMYYLNL
jgi:superfamily I DNA/RNA helicase